MKEKQAGSNKNQMEKYIDLKYLAQRTKADPGLMTQMISLYLGQTAPLIKEMMEAARTSEWKDLQSVAHKMIPSFSIVGIDRQYEDLAKKVQEYCRTGEQEQEIRDAVIILENVLTAACQELEAELDLVNKKTEE